MFYTIFMSRETPQVRLKRIMSEKRLRQVDILRMSEPWQKKLGVTMSKNTLSQYVNGKSRPDSWRVTLLSETLNVSESWLLGYDVPQAKNQENIVAQKTSTKIISSPDQVIFPDYVELERVFYSGLAIKFSGYTLTKNQVKQLRGVLYAVFADEIKIKPEKNWDTKIVNEIKVVESIEEPKADYDINDYRDDVITGIVSAGTGVWQSDNIAVDVSLPINEVPDKNEYDSIAKVIGNSMEPDIHNNDLLFIEARSQIDYNQIGIFQVNGENYVKKFRLGNDNIPYLESLNPDYDDIFLNEDDEIRVIGEVIGTYSN